MHIDKSRDKTALWVYKSLNSYKRNHGTVDSLCEVDVKEHDVTIKRITPKILLKMKM